MRAHSTAAEAGTSASGISTALDTGPNERGERILAQSAISAFLAGLPERRGRIVTLSSDPDSWKRKHPAIRARLAVQRARRAQT